MLLSTLLHLPQLHAQDSSRSPIEFGAIASLSTGTSAGAFPVYLNSPFCGLFDNGRVNALRLAGMVQWPSLLGDKLGLAARAGWTASVSRYYALPGDEQRLYDPETRTLIDIEREFYYDARTNLVELELLGRYPFSERWSIMAGPSLGYRYRAAFEQTDNVVNPPDRSFADGERVHPMELGVFHPERSLALGIMAAVSFTVPLSGRMRLVPELAMRGDILSPVRGANWRTASIGLGLAVLYAAPQALPEPPPPPPPDTVVAPPPELRAGITVRGIDDEDKLSPEAIITIREIILRQHTPVLPAVYFQKDLAQMPDRYVSRNREESDRFTLLDVAELGALELSHNLPNLVGYRMREQPAAKLTLFGMSSDDEPASLGLERAGRLRSYLTDVWGISRSRIEVRTGPGPLARSDESTSDGRDENRRVTFASDAVDLLAPLATERLLRDFNPPRIRLQPVIEAQAGILRWNITLRQKNEVLASFEGTGSNTDSSLRSDLSWRLSDDRIDSAAGFLTAELFVEDSAGQTITASDRVTLVLRRDSTILEAGRELHGEIERLSYELVAFGYRSRAGDREHERRLQELAERIRDSAHITVTGYTDRIGDDSYNLELSRGRADYMAQRLRELTATQGIRDLKFSVRGAGAETERFPNDLPEGRVLSRGATALVEQQPER